MQHRQHAMALGITAGITLGRTLVAGLALVAGVAMADTLSMPAKPDTAMPSSAPATGTMPAPATEKPTTAAPDMKPAMKPAMKMPVRGMTMQQVTHDFGAPKEKRAPVGDPPITRWVYPNYTVYFEYKYVIHSVPNSFH